MKRGLQKRSRRSILPFVSLFFLITICGLCLAPAWAGGPFFVKHNGSGESVRWSGNSISWVADSADLSSNISNEKAVKWIKELLDIWQNVSLVDASGDSIPAVDLDFEYEGTVAEDIDVDNYVGIVKEFGPAAVIIFDDTGEMIDSALGENAHIYVVGFASPVSNGMAFTGGIVVLNGLFIDGNDDTNGEISEDEFKGAMLHELGHLLNLDHTQANIEAVQRYEEGDGLAAGDIPTMYPVLYSSEQMTPKVDDIVALAEQYPSEEYSNSFCRITGELIGADGEGFQGADVIARAKDAVYEWEDVRTFVSGVLYLAGTADGSYVLGGLVPGRSYSVGFRGIDASFTGGSNIEPFDPPVEGIVSSLIADNVIACSNGGSELKTEVSTVTLDSAISLGSSDEQTSDDGANSADATSPAAGCSLIIR